MNAHKIFNLIVAFVFTFSFLGTPLHVSAQEASTPWLIAFPENEAVEGWEWPAGNTVYLNINNAPQGFIRSGAADVTPWGDPRTYVRFDFADSYDLKTGDVVTLTDNITTITYTVQNLSVTTVDATAETISGSADPGVVVQLWPHGYNPPDLVEATTTDQGTWLADFHTVGFDLVAGTGGRSQILNGLNATAVDWNIPSPSLRAHPVWESVDGWYWPLSANLHLTIDDPNTLISPDLEMDEIVNVVSDPPNNESVWFNFAGIYDLKPGDRVTLTDGTTTRSLEVSILSIKSVNVETNIVTGIAEPGAIVRLPMPLGAFTTTADSNGNWIADYSAAGLDLIPGSMIIAEVYNGEGDLTSVEWNVPERPPVLQPITAPVDPCQVNSTISATATFMDPDVGDTHTAVWDWGDGLKSAGTVDEKNQVINGSHVYTTAGVYTIQVTVKDAANSSASTFFSYVVIYDPSAGFVSGSGWFNSPAGAFTTDFSLTGKATFGFISKYQKGANIPTGNTEFQFKVGNLAFSSTTYDWLVIAGAKAQYKGTGTINGKGSYRFMLTAIDGKINGSGGVDKFRIKIWNPTTNEVIYDNQQGATDDALPTTTIQGGSIIIHK